MDNLELFMNIPDLRPALQLLLLLDYLLAIYCFRGLFVEGGMVCLKLLSRLPVMLTYLIINVFSISEDQLLVKLLTDGLELYNSVI